MNARHKGVAKLWLLNLFGNATLLAGVYCFLVLPDAHRSQVAASALLALIVAFGGLWLRAGSFAYFRVAEFRDAGCVWRAFRHVLRHIIALLIWIIPLAILEWLLFRCLVYAPQFGVWFWQKVPALRFGSPRAIFHVTEWLIWMAMALLAIIWLPVASTVAAAGLRPRLMLRSWRLLRRLSYWLWCCVLAFAGGYLPYKLVWWIPQLDTLKQQAWSAGLRFVLSYMLLISAWVALLLVIGDRLSQIDPIAKVTQESNPPA
ncbi:MAG TPA: hypothetical protein VFB04_17195 [Terriglobales bacterium]|nr:hypothetical protein [Terriglobales bacterium]